MPLPALLRRSPPRPQTLEFSLGLSRELSLGLFLLIGFAAVASGARALDMASGRHPFLGLDVVVEASEPPRLQSFGKLRAFLRALEQAGRSCKASTYGYGVTMACGAGDEPVLIDLEAVPTRAPDLLSVTRIRPKGRDSAPLTPSEAVDFLNGFTRKSPQ